MDANAVVTVTFELIPAATYDLSVTVTNPAGGSVSPSSGTYEDGTQVTLTATPTDGWQVATWFGTDDDTSTALTNTVTMDDDKDVLVMFEEIPIGLFELTATVTNPQGGSIVPTSGTYADGTTVNLIATPAAGYQIASWSGTVDDTSTAAFNQVVMNSNQTVSVTFELIPEYYDLNLSVDGGHGQVTADPDARSHLEGTVVDLTAVPDDGYEVAAWSGTDDDTATGTTNTVTMNGEQTVTVSFQPVFAPQTLTADQFKVKAGKDRQGPQDDFLIKGQLPETAEADFLNAGYVMITLFTDDADIYVSEAIGSDEFKVGKKPVYNYKAKVSKTSPAMLKQVQLNFDKGTFQILASHVDLTGLMSPFGVAIDFIDGNGLIYWQGQIETVPEAAIKGGLPSVLLMGHTDTLTLSKQPKVNKKFNKLAVVGEMTLADLDVDLTDTALTISWDDQSFELPAGSFDQKKPGVFKAKNVVVDAELNTKATVAIDINKGKFSVKLANAQDLSADGLFGLAFGTYDQSAQW